MSLAGEGGIDDVSLWEVREVQRTKTCLLAQGRDCEVRKFKKVQFSIAVGGVWWEEDEDIWLLRNQ